MSCDGPIAPGVDFEVAGISAQSDDDIGVTCSGQAVAAIVSETSPGVFTVKVKGSNVTCPGPLVLLVDDEQIRCWDVAPC